MPYDIQLPKLLKTPPVLLALSGGALIWGNAQQLQLHQGPLMWFPVVQDPFKIKNITNAIWSGWFV